MRPFTRAGEFEALSETIGEAHILTLSQHLGGVRLYIPAKLSTGHVLSVCLGTELGAQVCAEFAGLGIDIPRLTAYHREKRNVKIIAEFDAGMSSRALALKYQMTERNMRKILNKPMK